ncbi:CaiB/BaiF CoA-transferase family protein [Noviherbaspirillum sedimenti]|uniref:Carnitine dehydratase n=1 Tax=Noviherbaspirillum sedimenti TaxID=2320865 RepID=A0A3A3GLC9_9BURK|nr:CoA transferase [Noviherbaspirillum sedimenti]RJG03076.1 hypothetical protein D3878_17065 [Noviherbaspirillum sedimenti]
MSEPESVKDLVVVDLGVGMPSAIVAKFLREMGATVWRVAPPAGDPFESIYPAYTSWHSGSRMATPDHLDELLARADVCLIGGEDHPGLEWSFEGAALIAANPRLVVLQIAGYARGFEQRAAVDLLVQARVGLAFEIFSDRPVNFACPLPTYGAAIQGLLGVGAALVERERSGRGQLVETSLQQGAGMFLSCLWMSIEDTQSVNMRNPPKDVWAPIVRCADGQYVFFVPRYNGMDKVFAAFGIDKSIGDTAKKGYFGDIDLFQRYATKFTHEELLRACWAADVAAEKVLGPGECWDDEQVRVNGTIVTEVDGRRRVGTPLTMRAVQPNSGAPRTSLPSAPEDAAPLAGVRILDFGAMVAGAYGSKLLADLGADVIKVEPLAGDIMRTASYPNFVVSNQGKRSLHLDAKAPESMDVVRRLCATANAASHNFRVGSAGRIKLDPASLRGYRPDIVAVQCFSYGASGPRAMNAGLDPLMQAYCGQAVRAGGRDNAPLWYRNLYIDYATGAIGAIAMLFGIREQLCHGNAVEAETSLLEAGLFLMSELIQCADGSFSGGPPLDYDRTGFHCTECLYQTKDGWVAIAARSDDMAARLVNVLHLQGFPENSRSWGDSERQKIAERIRSRTTHELLQQLEAADVWCEKCNENGWQSLLDDPTARAANLIVETRDPNVGALITVGPLVSFSRSRLDANRPMSVPTGGVDTREILGELGYSSTEIDNLAARKVVA